jgi:Holliday junction DNA helicase RuvB
LRPTLNAFIGQENAKKRLRRAIATARKLNEPLPHMLFGGQAGLGKTTLAKAVAEEMGVGCIDTTADHITSREDVLSLLMQTNTEGLDKYGVKVGTIKPTIIFLDEVHKISGRVWEVWYKALEDFEFDVEVSGSMRLAKLPPFTMIGATTDLGDLPKPFRDRCGIHLHFEPYSVDELVLVTAMHAQAEGVAVTERAIHMIASRARGVPRVARNHLMEARRLQVAGGYSAVDVEQMQEVYDDLGLDASGLDRVDRSILTALSHGKTGLQGLAAMVGVDQKTLQYVHEPYLLTLGLISRGSGGRQLTPEGKRYMDKV